VGYRDSDLVAEHLAAFAEHLSSHAEHPADGCSANACEMSGNPDGCSAGAARRPATAGGG